MNKREGENLLLFFLNDRPPTNMSKGSSNLGFAVMQRKETVKNQGKVNDWKLVVSGWN